ncbi:MAG: non-canonical purine NTP pyrophosphatase, partial [Patescibacteria group bacterium]
AIGGGGIEFISLGELGIDAYVEETGATHEENAELKARFFYSKTGLPTIGEDSGIYVDALPDELGVKTRRFRGKEKASDEEWIEHFLKEMKNVPDKKRTARFVSHITYVDDSGASHHFHGETDGVITKTIEAPLRPGVPLSSCFRPDGFDLVYAALSTDQKSRISHRGKAATALVRFLQVNR